MVAHRVHVTLPGMPRETLSLGTSDATYARATALFDALVTPVRTVSWLGNLVGSVFLAYLVFASGAFAAPSAATVKAITTMKANLPFGQAVMRGILCNWLVVMGIWQATAAKDIVGKVFGIWLPISAFVTMGFEHSVANMFFLPMGLFQGAEVTWKMIFMNNLLPVTIGNTIAGAIFMAGSYALMYGKPSK